MHTLTDILLTTQKQYIPALKPLHTLTHLRLAIRSNLYHFARSKSLGWCHRAVSALVYSSPSLEYPLPQ